MADIITTLHPEGNKKDNLYPNIKKENIPDGSIDNFKLADGSIDANKLSGGSLEPIIYDWLNSHPEATTTVQDGSITKKKLDDTLSNDIELFENLSLITLNDLVYNTGNYINFNGLWKQSTLFGIAVIDVKSITKLVYKTNKLNSYLSNISFSYDKEVGSLIINHITYDSLGYKIIDVPEGARYCFIAKPIDENGNLGTSVLYSYVNNDKISNYIDNSLIEINLINETDNYVVSDNLWRNGSVFGSYEFITLNNSKKFIYINRLNNPYIKQLVFVSDNNYNSANIIATLSLNVGLHLVDVPEGAKYLAISTPIDPNGNRGLKPSIYLYPNNFISALYDKNSYQIPNTIINEPYTDLELYIKNLCIDDLQLDVTLNDTASIDRTKQYNDNITFNSISQGSIVYNFSFYNKNNLIKRSKLNVIYNNLTRNNKKVLVIGDSTIAGIGGTISGTETNYMISEFSRNNVELSLIGTMGTGLNKYEGRPGWSISDYLHKSDNNAFYNTSTNEFDFNYYLTNNNLETPDYVIIQLGINDMFYGYNSINSYINTTYNNLKIMINKILSFSSNIKVFYNLIIMPHDDQNVFTNDYGISVKQFQAKFNFIKFNEYVIENLLNDISERCYIIPTNLITNSDDMYNSVHPNDSGYEKIAKLVCKYLWYY